MNTAQIHINDENVTSINDTNDAQSSCTEIESLSSQISSNDSDGNEDASNLNHGTNNTLTQD